MRTLAIVFLLAPLSPPLFAQDELDSSEAESSWIRIAPPPTSDLARFGGYVALAGDRVFATYVESPDAEVHDDRRVRLVALDPDRSSSLPPEPLADELWSVGERLVADGDLVVAAGRERDGSRFVAVFDGTAEQPLPVRLELTGPQRALAGPRYRFGDAIAVAHGRVAVSAPRFERHGLAGGDVLVFERNAAGRWACAHALPIPEELTRCNGSMSQLAMTRELLFVGGQYAGEFHAYRFTDDGGIVSAGLIVFTQAPEWGVVEDGASFGESLLAWDERLVVGSPWQYWPDDLDDDVGFVRQYVHDDGEWILHHAFSSAEPVRGGHFGCALARDGELVAIGQRGCPAFGDREPVRGAVELFELTRGGLLLPSDRLDLRRLPSREPLFGSSVALRGGLLAVGSPGEGSGAVYVWRVE